MEKLRKYRFLKSIEKALNAPARPDDVYITTASDMYVGNSKPRTGSHLVDPARNSRESQVAGLAKELLELIEVAEKPEEERDEQKIRRGFVEVSIRLDELDAGILFTDAEKEGKRSRTASRQEDLIIIPSKLDLPALRLQITTWQAEQAKHKRKLYKIETTVRDLGVNVHDSRCRQMAMDRKRVVEGMQGSTERGVSIFRGVEKLLRGDG